MGRALDRLPLDYPSPRKQRASSPSADFHQDTLIWTPPSAEEVAAAHRYIEAHAPDLLDVLGLGEPVQRVRPLDVACPSCGAAARRRCVSPQGNDVGHPHAARRKATGPTEEQPPMTEAIQVFPTDAKIDAVMPDRTHRYWSTHCRHERHSDCSAVEVTGRLVGALQTHAATIRRLPAQCKTCAAACICPCHKSSTEEAGPPCA